jgi:hypothetical protein
VGSAPGECGNNVAVIAKNVEGGTLVATGEVCLENAGGVVGGSLAGEDGSSGFEELNNQYRQGTM